MAADRRILRLRKLEAGGHEVLDSDGRSLGWIPHADLIRYVRQYSEGVERLSSDTFSEGTLSIDREVTRRMRAFMEETGADVGYAFKKVLASDEQLARRYREAHRSKMLP